MLNLKKVIASICVIALMLSTVAFAANYSDVAENSAYYEAVETLSKLGIVTGYEDGSYKPEVTVTRAEMAALVARIQGYDETAKANADTIFTDVPKAHWASGYVAQAANQGIINGYGDGTFGPDDTVTYEQAVKMIMATLGFTPYANFNGGYPTGYLTAATRYGVTNGVSNAVVGTGANRGTIAQLLNNAIDTPLMVQNSWSTNGEVQFVVYDGSDKVDNLYKTLMSEYLGVVKLKGVVVENSVINTAGSKTIENDKAATIEVDVTDNFSTNHKDFQFSGTTYNGEDVFLVGESDAEDFIGQAVVLYVVENDDDEYEVVSIAADTTKNEIVTINLSQFGYYEAGKIYYAEEAGDDDYIYEEVEATNVIFNGNRVAASTVLSGKGATDKYVAADGLTKLGGEIVLVNNDKDPEFDLIFVEIAATAVVEEVADEVVTFKENAAWILYDDTSYMEISEIDFAEKTNKVISLVKDGEEIAYTDLNEWDVLSVLANNESNKGLIQVEVISNAIEGAISASSKSNTSVGGKAYTIDGKKYDVAVGYKTDSLAVGDAGTFYIDKYGKIAAFNEDSTVSGVAGSYAYILKMVADEDSMGEKELVFLLLTADGIKEVNAASRVKVNYATDATVVRELATDLSLATPSTAVSGFFTGTGVAEDIVVKYTVNSKGELNSITTANHNDRFELTATYNAAVSNQDQTYDADKGKLGKFVDADATVFFIDAVDKKSTVGTLADLSDETDYNVRYIYADNKAVDNNIIVILGGMDNIAPSTTAAIITDIATGIDEEGATIYTLSYVQDGEEVTGVSTVEDVVVAGCTGYAINKITIGDIVKVKLNSAGNIVRIEGIIDFVEGGRLAGAGFDSYVTAFASGTDYVGGPVAWAKKGGYVAFNTTGGASYNLPLESEADIINLNKADQISVVEFKANGSVSVKNGSGSNFKFYEKLYDDNAAGNAKQNDVKIYDAEALAAAETALEIAAAAVSTEDGTLGAIEAYTDHVFCRYYDGDLVEVVIVKAPLEIKVK